MDERLKFIARLLGGEKMAAVWRDFNVSRKTGLRAWAISLLREAPRAHG
jgi:hypothetical protein